jgi:hypothetical protein
MKKLLLVLATGTLLFSCNNNKKEAEAAKNSDWVAQNLKGKVQSMEESSYTPDSTGKIGAMDSCCINAQLFDEKGYMTDQKNKDSKGTVKDETVLSRYDGGQVKQVVNLKDGKRASTFSLQIGADGKYSGAVGYDSAGKVASIYSDLKEDDYGAITAGTERKADSTVRTSFTTENHKGMQVSTVAKDSSGKVVYSAKSELNDKGDVIKTTETNQVKDSAVTKMTTYKYDSYDEQGNWTQRSVYDEKGKLTKVIRRAYVYFKKD